MTAIDEIKKTLAEALLQESGLKLVEDLVRSKFASESELLSAIPSYQFDLGGKRIRPLLALTCAKALGMREPIAELVDIAAGIELIHLATLLHDDIIDKSPLRRKMESAFIKYGVPSTLLAGDFLLVRAFSLCAHLDRYIIAATEKACVHLTEGEIEERPLYEKSFNLKEVLQLSRKKTASLFKLATLSAAHLCEESAEVVGAAAEFGENLGLAFQAIDDILDVQGAEEVFGKKPGQDIRERKPSIVNVLWLESASALSKKLLEQAGPNEDQFVQAALEEVCNSQILDKARQIALDLGETCHKSLRQVKELALNPNPQALARLDAIIDFTLSRIR